MVYFRIYEALDTRTCLGYGLHGARWNHNGTPLIYAANSVSLAMMELLSIKGPILTTGKWILSSIEVSDKLPAVDKEHLPEGWDARPATNTTKDFGTSWALGKSSIALKVPSARIPLSSYPREHNLLINPMHPDFNKEILIIKEEELFFNIETG